MNIRKTLQNYKLTDRLTIHFNRRASIFLHQINV